MEEYVGYKFNHPDGGNYIIVGFRLENDDYILDIVRQDIVLNDPKRTISWKQFKNEVKNIWR